MATIMHSSTSTARVLRLSTRLASSDLCFGFAAPSCRSQQARAFAINAASSRTAEPSRARSFVLTSFARSFTSSTTSRTSLSVERPHAESTVLLSYPAPPTQPEAAEDEDEPDVELLPPEEAQLEITDRAAEQLRNIAGREKHPGAALRILVESGGCHGYQYKMELAKQRNMDDYHFSHPTIKPSNILVDAVSMTLLKGSTIDFATELIGSSFRVVDNPQAKGSGCGCGVSWELKA